MKNRWKRLAASLAVPLAVGGLSGLITKDDTIMFELVNKPPLAPPGWLFPAVWTLLYILMGLASYLVWVSAVPPAQKKSAAVYYAVSLALNFSWPIIFFVLDRYLAAFILLCLLWGFVLLTSLRFRRIDAAAGLLMLPYLLWTAFAGYLNLGIYLLN